MSSTAMVSKLLAERMELDTPHGRAIVGVLLFQDLAVVPLLILVPVLGQPGAGIVTAMAIALAKAVVVLAGLLVAGPRLRPAVAGAAVVVGQDGAAALGEIAGKAREEPAGEAGC